MKKILFVFLLVLISSLNLSAQDEKKLEEVSPSFNVELKRKVTYLDIEGKEYKDVVVKMKSFYDFWSNKDKVKVLVTDSVGKKIYKKTFTDSYLYIFTSGQIQIGKPRINKVYISNPYFMGESLMGIIREEEGVF